MSKNFMNKEKIREIVYILVAVVIAVIAVKIFIWLLPIILIVLLAICLYNSMKRSHRDSKVKDDKKKKTITIIDEEKDK